MIQEIFIKNFKCFEQTRIPFSNLTVLSGLNGMGKSSVLQSLLLLRQSARRTRLPSRRTRLTLNGDLVNLGTAKDVLYEEAKDDIISFEVRFGASEFPQGKSKIWTWRFKYEHSEANAIPGDVKPPDDLDFYREPLFRSQVFHYLQAERVGPRTYFSASDYDSRRGEIGTRGEYTVHFLSAFGETEMRNSRLGHPNATSNSLRDQVEAWIGEISPAARIHLTPYREIDLVSLRYSFAVPGHVSNPYRSTNVGFGITYTLPVIVSLLSSSPGRSLLLLENPEAHLHPRGQSRLGELMARAAAGGVQVVAETHSDHVLNGIRLAVHKGHIDPNAVALHFLGRPPDGRLCCEVMTPQLDAKGRIDRWPEGFFDEWDKSLEALLDEPKP